METVEERSLEPGQDYPSSADVGHELVPEIETDDAVLVRVVGTPAPPETYVDWEAFPAFIAGNTVQIAGANRNRARLFIRNGNAAAGDSVSLMPTGTTAREFGYVLEAQDAVEFFHNGPVWAQCASGESATLAVFVEYVTE
jgi:hypothetical protein